MLENASHVPETVERFLDSTLDSVDQAEELASAAATRAGFGEDDLMRIGMAVREAMVNAVAHGNRYNANKKVRFALSFKPAERFMVVIADEGEGFDFEGLPDPLAPENLLRTSGRGIFLIRSFMDDVQLRRLDTGGTEVTLVKNVESK
jgi:serine/threonine-protein kinase RsbW